MTVIDLSADFRAVLGRGARKRLARELRVSEQTVKDWFAGRWPASRRDEFGETLQRFIERQREVLRDVEGRARLLAGGFRAENAVDNSGARAGAGSMSIRASRAAAD